MIELLAAYGLCFALMNDKVVGLDVLRRVAVLDRMLNCAFCTGFHAGIVVRLSCDLVDGVAWSRGILREGQVALLWGFAGAAFCYSLDVLLQRLESSRGDEET